MKQRLNEKELNGIIEGFKTQELCDKYRKNLYEFEPELEPLYRNEKDGYFLDFCEENGHLISLKMYDMMDSCYYEGEELKFARGDHVYRFGVTHSCKEFDSVCGEIMCGELTDSIEEAIALYKEVVNDRNTYENKELFISEVNVNDVYVKGFREEQIILTPVEDYLDREAYWCDCNSYEELLSEGRCIELSSLCFGNKEPLTDSQTRYVQAYFDHKLPEKEEKEQDPFAQYMNPPEPSDIPLKKDDLVVYFNGDIRQVRENSRCKDTGLGICNRKGAFLTYAGSYNEDLTHKKSDVLDIVVVIHKEDPNYDRHYHAFLNDERYGSYDLHMDESEQEEER